MTKQIPLTQGKVALVDDDMFTYLMQWAWHARKSKNGKWYAVRMQGNRLLHKPVQMHREIMKTPIGMDTDHWDGNGLNNQRYNLRVCTHAQNTYNKGISTNNTSGYKGVYWNKARGKWQAQIMFSRKRIPLGRFATPEEAARAYDRAARKYFGPFAKTNFPEEG